MSARTTPKERRIAATCNGTDHRMIDRYGRLLWCLPIECAVCGTNEELA